MCFEFSSCFGGGRIDDYGGERSNRHRNENTTAYHNQPPPAVDKAGHKAYHDGVRKADIVGDGDRHGGYADYTQHKAAIETPKVPAWPTKVGDDACKYRARLQEPPVMDYHHYPTTTATTALERW